MERMRNIVETCVYITPGQNAETFKRYFKELMKWLNESQTFVICVDFNIDLNVSKYKTSSHFLDALYIVKITKFMKKEKQTYH